MNLRTIDLNLLPVFEAIYVERSLTRASEALHITQPAVSNALARLRAALGDPLFVRAARGMAPTPAADALIGPVREALARLRSGLDQRTRFDPATSERVFSAAMGEVAAAALAPALAARLEKAAPEVRFNIVQFEREKVARELAGGAIDFAVDIPSVSRGDLDSESFTTADSLVCVFRRQHPALKKALTLARFLALRLIVVSARRTGRTVLDLALAERGERVRPAMRLTRYAEAFDVVRATDMALVAPISVARRHDVAARALPFVALSPELKLFWRREARHDPAIGWARDELLAVARSIWNPAGSDARH
jgi:DNA-binding transcriptional LysR family regulator